MKIYKCPKCGREIHSLLLRAKQRHDFRVYPDEGGHGLDMYWVGESDPFDDLEDEKYYCPKCGAILFINMDDVMDFFLGKQNETKQDNQNTS